MLSQKEAVKILTSILASTDCRVEVGAGVDDIAVLKFGNSRLAVTTDYLNFSPLGRRYEAISLRDCGYILVMQNVSDLIASGATPLAGVVSLGLPRSLKPIEVREIAEGIRSAALECSISIVGGDTKEAPHLTLNATLFGELGSAGLWARSGANPGDSLFVSGQLGGVSAAVLALSRQDLGEPINRASAQALARPVLPLSLTKKLRSAGIRVGAIDISDGLGMNLHQLADASDVGLEIDALDIPLHPLATIVADKLRLMPWRLAFGFGGDGQFVFSVRSQDESIAIGAGGVKVGRVTKSKNRVIIHSTGCEPLPFFGHEDFASEPSINTFFKILERS